MALSWVLYNIYFLSHDSLKIYLQKIWVEFFMILCRINKGLYPYLFEHANKRKHVYEHNCSSVRVFLNILAYLAYLAHHFFMIWNAMSKRMIWLISDHANGKKHVNERSCSSVSVRLSILAHLAQLTQSIFLWFSLQSIHTNKSG